MAWHYRIRLIIAYASFFGAIGFSLMIPHLFGTAVDTIVGAEPDRTTWIAGFVDPIVLFFGNIFGNATDFQMLMTFTLAILAVSLGRGFFDFARTYTTDSLSQFVSYDMPVSI